MDAFRIGEDYARRVEEAIQAGDIDQAETILTEENESTAEFRRTAQVTEATILKSNSIEFDRDPGFEIEYEYRGPSGEAYRAEYTDSIHAPDRNLWSAYTDARRKGGSIQIFYDPQNPARHDVRFKDDGGVP
ncbi:MAG: DUF3592 domain-containing protein [bacterium]|nr:DUF3592 domain-containing protein [bacterium]